MWDIFLSYAREDRVEALELAQQLRVEGLDAWHDELLVHLGDPLRRSIDRGLADSRYGVVLLSHAFFEKRWPQRELDALFALEEQGRKKLLPVLKCLSRADLADVSPLISDRVSASLDDGMDHVVDEIPGHQPGG